MELSELIFTAKTDDLERVSKVIGGLVTDISKLDKVSRDAAKTEATLARAAKDNAKANLDNAKAQDTLAKTMLNVDKAANAAAAATEKKAKATEKSTEATARQTSVLQKQKDILEFQTQGFSKGQAGILAYGKAAGLAANDIEELGKVLETQRKLMGGDPFDKSLSGLKSLQNQYTELKESVRQYATDSNLSAKQTRELARDKERLIEKMKVEGASFSDIRKAVRAHNDEYVKLATQYNNATSAEDAVIKSRREAISATNYLTQADQRMAAALNQSNASLDKAGTDSLVKYETALRKSGVSQDVATAKLATYKAQLTQVNTLEQKRREQHLASALSPQLTDIGVSLYSGQAPLTVLLQQGGQISDLLRLSGVEAKNFGKALRDAFGGMIPVMATVAKGLGGFVFGLFYDAGKGITNFIANVTGMNKVLQHTDDILYLIGGRATWFSNILATLGTIASVTFGAGILAIVSGLASLAVGLKQVITENNDLAKAFALSGASIGLSHTQMIGYVKTLADSGATTGQATEALLAMAKAGNFTSSEILLVSDSAIQMQKGFGIAIEDTVKQFAKLKEKPVEALLEIAKSSGMVGPEVIKMVQELERAGKSTEAASVAMKAYADVTKQQVAQMKENYNGFALFMIDLGQKIKQFFSDTFKTLFLATDPNQQLEDQLGKLRERIKEVSGNLKTLGSFGDPKLLNQLKEQERMLISQIGANVRIRGEEEKRKYLNAENAKYESAIASLRGNALDSIEKETRKTQTLAEFRKSFINDKLKEAAKEKSVDIEKLKLNTDLMNVLKQQADIEYKKQKKSGSKSENYYATLMREATNNTIAANTATQELTKSEQKLLEVKADPRFAKLTAIQQADVIAKYNAAIAAERQTAMTEKLAEAEEHRLKLLGKSEGIGKQYYADMQKLEEFAKVAGWSREEIEELTRAVFKQTPAWKAYEKALEDVNTASKKFQEDSLASQASVLQENQSLDHRLSLLGRTAEEQKAITIEYQRANKIREVDIKLARQLREIEEKIAEAKKKGLPESDYKPLIDAEIQARKDAAEQYKVINREVAVQYAEDMQREFDAIKSGISDSIVTALFEGGKAGSKKLRDLVINELKKPVTLVVNAVINTLLGSVMGSLFGGAAGGVAGAAGSSLLGSAAASAGGSLLAGATGIGTGTSLMGGFSGSILPAGMVGPSVAAPTLMSGLGNALSAIPGWGWILAGAALFGKKLFGRTLKDTGIQGTFGGESGFQGQSYRYYRGGLFRSDKTTTEALDEGTRKQLGDAFIAMRNQVTDFAKVLGLNTDKLKGFTSSIKISLSGLKDNEIEAKLQEALATANNELAQQVIGTWETTTSTVSRQIQSTFMEIEAGAEAYRTVEETITASTYVASEYAREGEKAIDTLTRLATSLGTVNGVFDTLGYTLYESSLAGGDMASKLSDLFGGLDNLVSATTAYYQNFYSEEERQATALRQLTSEFKKHNVALPKTREEYRKLVEAQDLTTEEGRKMYAWLIQLAPAFAEISKTAEEVAAAAEEVRKNAIEAAYSALETAVNAQKEILKVQEDAAQAVVTRLQSIFDLLEKNVKELYTQVDSTAGMLADQGRAVIQQALSSGVLPDADVLGNAISAVRTSIDSTAYTTQFDQDKARLQLAAELKTLQDQAGEQLSTAELILKGIKDQIEYLDNLLKTAREQADTALGIKNVVLSVADALQALADAIAGPQTNTNAPSTTSTGGSSGGPVFGPGGNGNQVKSKYNQVTALGTVGVAYMPITDEAYVKHLDTLNDLYHSFDGTGNLKGLLDSIKAAGGTLADLSALSGYYARDWAAAAQSIGVQPFANGGAFTNGVVQKPTVFNMGLMGEAGSEAILPLTNVGGKLGVHATSSGESDTSALEARVENMSIELQVIALNTSKVARLLERVTRDGDSLITKDYTVA